MTDYDYDDDLLPAPLASRTDIGLQHPSTTFLSRGRLLKHTRTPHLTQNTDPRNAHAGTKTQHQD